MKVKDELSKEETRFSDIEGEDDWRSKGVWVSAMRGGRKRLKTRW